MKPDVAITLVIPSYNRAQLILETINSALNQTSPFAEIIVVDDASTDGTLLALEQFDGKISVIASEKVGVQTARNRGVAAASTDYVALCDSDDLLEPDFVQVISKWLSSHPECDSVYSNFVTFDENTTSSDKFSGAPTSFFKGATFTEGFCSDIPDLYVKTVGYQPLFSSGVTIKKSFYQAIGGYNSELNGVGSEDWEYTLRAVEAGVTSVCMKPLVRIRRHSGNDSGNKIKQLLGEVIVLEHALKFHQLAKKYSAQINSETDNRRAQAFELAFSASQYKHANAILSEMSEIQRDFKFITKILITKLVAFAQTITPFRDIRQPQNSTK